jgi:hypothetical protein
MNIGSITEGNTRQNSEAGDGCSLGGGLLGGGAASLTRVTGSAEVRPWEAESFMRNGS